MRFIRLIACFAGLSLCSTTFRANPQTLPVTVQVEVRDHKLQSATSGELTSTAGPANVVVWLLPLGHAISGADQARLRRYRPRLTQRNKSFDPHLLVVQVGTVIDFPNRDPFFHNVFSLFDGKRFDLGLYEAGATNSSRFDRAGVSFLFCNIHPEMSAVVVTVNSPYYAISDRSGRASLANVPDGTYEMHVWAEQALPAELKTQTRVIAISATMRTLPPIHFSDNPNFNTTHKNKYGQDYVPPPENRYSHP